MPWWRRESLHERLAREGGLTRGAAAPHDVEPRWGETGIHGVPRPRQWDAVGMVAAPELRGDALTFVALPDGTLLVEEGVDDGALAPLAETIEGSLRPPYRAEAVRRDGSLWAVGARAIEVVEVPDEVDGDEIELAIHDGERTLLVDGARVFGSVPTLERLGESRSSDYTVRAERLDGRLFEVRVSPL